MFSVQGTAFVAFTEVRVRLYHAATTEVALDTTVAFPSNADSIRVPLTVALATGATSEDFDLTLALIDATGDTVFRGGPIRVTASVGTPTGTAPLVPLTYVGVGSNAASVRFTTAPASAFFGDTVLFVAGAFDSSGTAIAGTPIVYSVSPPDSLLASVPNPAAGRVVARPKRGQAHVVATLLTGPTATAALAVQPRAAAIAVTGGNNQSAPAATALPQPVTFRVKAADSLGVAGVAVSFAVATGGGSLGASTATTDTAGYASVGWTLGALVAAQTMTATVAGLTPATATATGTGPLLQLSVAGNLVAVGGSNLALVKLPQPAPSGGVTVTVTSDSTQYVTVAPPGTIAFAAGDTLKAITINGVAIGPSVLHATATGYGAAVTAVVATPNIILLQQSDTVRVGQSGTLGITITSAAPTGGLVVTLLSTDTTKLKLTTPTMTIPATLTAGSATVQGVAIGTVAVVATATGYAPGGAAVTVANAATTLALVSGGGQSASPGTQLPSPIIVKASDAQGNGVPGVAVTFAVATGGGSVGTPNATTNALGQASTTWTLGSATGQQSITATATGLAGSPITIVANPNGVIASTTVSPKPDTLTALTATVQLAAQAKDAGGNNLTGSFTWASRTLAVATVSASGLVTAVTNGSSYVVATEAGGTKDSALVVVQQKLASITVTPASKNIYLGANYTLAASAVDGLGKPMATGLTYTWSTTAPAVATVDTTGLVVGVGLGSAQIKATSGAITGVASVSILTAITRIAVAVDSGGATKSDTASLASLAITRRYHAYAYDTLNAVMPAVTQFTWASTNPSVASVPNVTTDTVTATSAANGVTTIKATAQGFVSAPGAALTVAQVLASIQLSPAKDSIGVNGSVGLIARGLDANNRYISGGAFTYRSKYPTIATVDSVSGVVKGVVIGTDTVTASSGAITSNVAVITVSASVPLALSFGRDTVSVGRGSQASIPVLLSSPAANGLVVKLGVSPAAYAHWNSVTVAVSPGANSANATLVGDSAGTTTVTASDSSGLGYAAASAVAKVTANMNLTSSSYSINATDVVTTQVLLSDPSPAGGTYVTFNYGTAGIASVSPTPAFIPAGQLAADVQISALAAGTTTITPQAVGVNGAASSFTAYAPVLTISPSYELLGVGQYYEYGEVYLPTYTNNPLVVTLTSSDTSKVTAPPVVTVPANNSAFLYFNITGTAVGRAAITPSAPGWTASNTDSVIVTTPHVGACCNSTIYSTAGTQTVTVYSEDSTKNIHYRTNSLQVSLQSSDTTVMKVLDPTITVPAGSYYAYPRVTPVLGGSAYLIASAGGHTSDSVLYTVKGPPLYLNWTSRLVGVGQQDINTVYVSVPNAVPAPMVVRLSNSDSTKAAAPDSVIIPTGSTYVYFPVQGFAVGVDTIRATAPGFQTDSAVYAVTPPAIILGNTSFAFNNYNAGSNFYVYSADTTRGTHYRITPDTISLAVRDMTVATLDSATVIIAAGQYYNYSRRVAPSGVGSTYVVLSAGGGQRVFDSLKVTVNTPTIGISLGTTTLGRRQHISPNFQGFDIYTPDSRAVPVPATMTQKHSAVDSLTTLSPTIPASYNYAYLDAFGLANGTDTLTVSATGYNSGNPAYITVMAPRLGGASLPSSTTTTNLSAIGVYVYARDSVGYGHYTMDTVTVHAVASDTTVIKVDSAYYHIPKNGYYVPASVHVSGPGSAYVVFSDSVGGGYLPDTTNAMTVTGPSLYFSPTSTVLGMRQTPGPNGVEVYTQNSVVSPLVVHLMSTATTVVTVPDSVIIPAGYSYAYFPVNAMDTIGTIQVQATATGFGAAAMSVQVTRPKFVISTASQLNTTSPRTPIYVYAEDANNNWHYTTDSVVVKLASSAPGVATIDSATVTIPKGQYYNGNATWSPASVSTPGTSQLSATDTTAAFYAYTQATFNIAVVTPTLTLSWGTQTLGVGQYNTSYVYSPNTATAPIVVSLSHPGTPRTATTVNGVAVSVDTIPTNTNSTGYFHVVGTTVGWDTLVASASSPPFNPSTGFTAVSQGHVDQLGNWPAALSISGTDSVLVYLYARDSLLTTHYVQDSTTFTLAPNSNIQFWSGGASSALITSVVIPKDANYVTFYVKAVSQGPGQSTISATNYVTYNTPTITVSP